MKNWVIQYVYATEKAEQGVSILEVEAETIEEAKKIAVQKAAAEEYIFNVYPQSDEQFLGSVKHQANMLVGKGEYIDSEEA
ncbi:hypothetical protein MTBPR1_10056 [Candidatus Terasakiella magnetica]|uniref:Uncharacterized protein n=1 Tax=Candidatus Terasakiella magnetica TaxID=1867952 RepID=A0A1C3RC05_9PROT|nr:hypothetical protein [Candidatus Terasakiella magnetica]SCA54809.1 hypothetical protein MTBPR1_10056 [Candidatus Terasakiella magnetica]